MSLASFLKDAASLGSGIKYRAEKNAQHRLYIVPLTMTDEEGNSVVGINAEAHNIHEWKVGDKFFSAECTKDRTGTCPFCDRVNDAWSIYKMRIENVTAALKAQGLDDGQIQWKIKGEQDKDKRKQANAYKGLSAVFLDELKMKAVKPYLYMLVAQYELDAAGNPVCEKGVPKYSIKIMKLPETRVQKLLDIFATSGGHIEGNEITIQYGNYDESASLVGQSTIAAVFPDYTYIKQFPGLKEKIEEEAAKFDMTSLDKSFEELKEFEPDAAKSLADTGFAAWDRYIAEKAVNPNALYLEYNDNPAAGAPQIGQAPTAGTTTFALPTGMAQPQAAPIAQPVAQPVAPPVAQPTTPVQTQPVMPPTGQPVQTQPVVPPTGQAPVQTQPDAAATATPAFNFKI